MKVSLKKPVAILSTVALASTMLVGAATPALASDVAYNPDAVITVMANNPTYTEANQSIDGTIVFGSDVTGTEAAVQAYLQDNVTIAGRTIKADNDGYTRIVSDVTVDGNMVTFKIGPNEQGMTANYSAEFKLSAVADERTNIAAAMGNADAETIIGSQLAVERTSATSAAAKFSVAACAQARYMNHILITDMIDGQEQAIFEGTGTFANGGITVHSHAFTTQTEVDYAAAIVAAAITADNPDYTFVDLGNGEFSISRIDATSANIQVYIYDCNYLNAHELAVGDIWEPEWSELFPED